MPKILLFILDLTAGTWVRSTNIMFADGPAFSEEGFLLPAQSPSWDITENANVYYVFSKYFFRNRTVRCTIRNSFQKMELKNKNLFRHNVVENNVCAAEVILSCQQHDKLYHYNDVIMSAISSLITSFTIVYSSVYSGTDQRKDQSVTGLCEGNSPVTGEFPTQRASNAENVSIWWRHHEYFHTCRLQSSPRFTFCSGGRR